MMFLRVLFFAALLFSLNGVFTQDISATDSSPTFFSPKLQLELGVPAEHITCRDNHILVFRTNGFPACVTQSTADKLEWNIISEIQKIIYDYPMNSKSFDSELFSEPKGWGENFEVMIYNLPNIGETAEVLVTITNNMPFDLKENLPNETIEIQITDNFEFVDVPTDKIIIGDDSFYYRISLDLEPGEKQNLSATVKAVKSGMGYVAGDAGDWGFSYWMFVDENKTLLLEDYYKLNPDKDPANQISVAEYCPDGPCEEPTPQQHPSPQPENGISASSIPTEEFDMIEEEFREALKEKGYSDKEIEKIVRSMYPDASIQYDVDAEPSSTNIITKLSKMPRLNEIVTLTVSVYNDYSNPLGTTTPPNEQFLEFYLKNSWEFVNVDEEIGYTQFADDGPVIKTISKLFTVPIHESQTFTVQVKPTKIGINILSVVVPYVDSTSISLFVGEDETFYANQYYEKYPEKHPWYDIESDDNDDCIHPCVEPEPVPTIHPDMIEDEYGTGNNPEEVPEGVMHTVIDDGFDLFEQPEEFIREELDEMGFTSQEIEEVLLEIAEEKNKIKIPDEKIFSQTESTEKGTLDVKISYNKIIPGDITKLGIDFINIQTQKIQEHIDYRITISKDGKAILGPTPLLHTSAGTGFIPVEFLEEGVYSIDFEIEGILFAPIPLEKVSFDVTVG